MKKCRSPLMDLQALQTSKNGSSEEKIREKMSIVGSSMMECAQIPFPNFYGSNFREWKAEAV